MKYIKEHWKFYVSILVAGIIGGILTGFYAINLVDPKALELVIEQIGSKEILIAITAVQYFLYAAFCGFFGIILANKVGLWKEIKIEKEKLLAPIIIGIIGGLTLVFADLLIFSHFNEIIRESFNNSKPSLLYMFTAFIQGGICEEVMMRLFFMSFIAFIIYKIFYKKEEEAPIKALVIANIIAAIFFALGHIPATIQSFGLIDAPLFIRCMLLNGVFGLAFGWLYRKYGIQYAMLAHFGCHLISQLLLFLI